MLIQLFIQVYLHVNVRVSKCVKFLKKNCRDMNIDMDAKLKKKKWNCSSDNVVTYNVK